MRLSAEIQECAGSIARDCGVDSVCALLSDATAGAAQIHVLGNFGVDDAVLDLYREHRICDHDPFHDLRRHDRAGFRAVDHPTVQRCGEEARDYWRFVGQQDIEVVGAAVLPLQTRLHLSIGVHRGARLRHRRAVPVERLASRIEALQQRIALDLLRAMLASGRGYQSLVEALRPAPAAPPPAELSARETEIARLVCQGKQNKEIAWSAGLSEYTVENHLRRIYRKFGIHNRAALVARMAGA